MNYNRWLQVPAVQRFRLLDDRGWLHVATFLSSFSAGFCSPKRCFRSTSRCGVSLTKSFSPDRPLSRCCTGSPPPAQLSKCELSRGTALPGAWPGCPGVEGHSTKIRALGRSLVVVSLLANWLTWASYKTSLTSVSLFIKISGK